MREARVGNWAEGRRVMRSGALAQQQQRGSEHGFVDHCWRLKLVKGIAARRTHNRTHNRTPRSSATTPPPTARSCPATCCGS